MAEAHGRTRRNPSVSEARPRYSPVRVVCGEGEEFSLEQTTFGEKNALAPSSPHSGSSVRVQ